MTDYNAITTALVTMNGYKPSRHQATLNKLDRLARSRGLSIWTRDRLRKAAGAVENGAPLAALRILEERTR